ncbi:hypothetical protein FIBSPDRAFT_761911, partial [Athelia psychrophila]
LGTSKHYTVHNGEAVSIIMGMHLLLTFTRRLIGPTIIGCDNQAVIRGLTNQQSHSGHHLLDAIHDPEEHLHAKQDGITRSAERTVHWVPGHKDFAPNKRADRGAKAAAQKLTSLAKDLPACLRKKALPASVAVLRQEYSAKLKRKWTKRWRKSPRSRNFGAIDKSAPLTKFLKTINSYSRSQAVIIAQFRTNHVPLNQTLFRIGHVESPACPHCGGITVETIRHYIIDCPHYALAQHNLQRDLGRKAGEIPFLLGDKLGVEKFLRYVGATNRFKT